METRLNKKEKTKTGLLCNFYMYMNILENEVMYDLMLGYYVQ
jgi:hypothetical protein